MDIFNSPDYKRSRASYTVQCAVEYFISLLVTDAFLVRLLTYIGISDALTGIISSFISLAFLFQILAIFAVRAKMGPKRMVLIYDTASIFLFMFLYVIPFLPVASEIKKLMAVASILLAYAGKYVVNTMCYKWGNSYVHPHKRAEFSANKEIISLLSGMVFSIVMAAVVDKFEGLGNLDGAFLFLSISILVLNIGNFTSLFLIKRESPEERKVGAEPFSFVLKNTLGNKNFRSLVILDCIFKTAIYMTVGFMGTFKYKELAMSAVLVQVVNIVANLLRAAVSRPLGKYSDRKTFAKGFELGLYLALCAFAASMFTTEKTWLLILLHTAFYNASAAGTNQNSFNMAYSYVDAKYVVQALAIRNAISGTVGFLASLLGGWVLGTIQANGNTLFGIHVYGQQVLSFISLVLTLVTIVYIKKVVEKQKVMKQ